MIEKNFNITATEGLHARPSSALVAAVSAFKSEITLKYNEKTVNLKSILGVMSLGVSNGSSVTISASGEDEAAAMAKIEEIFLSEGIGQ
ncbi:MAG: phosphocarrier protein HPr [Paenisporosarcina sp.]